MKPRDEYGDLLTAADVQLPDDLPRIDQGRRYRREVPARVVADELGYEGPIWNPDAAVD